MYLKILVVMFIHIKFVYNCAESQSQSEVTETSYVSGEYMNVWKTIPALFEYVFDLIEHKPDILEKDDITVFTEDSAAMFDGTDVDNNVRFGGDKDGGEQSRFDIFWDWYPGFAAKKFDLSPSEITEKTLEVEKQLEEYNDNTRKS